MNSVTTSLLDRPTYEVGDGARLLGVPPSTLRWWLQGSRQGERIYLPVLRRELNRDAVVRWGEFIEAAVLRFLRSDRKVPMRDLRLFMHEVRANYPDLPYPLASERLFLNGSRLALSDLRGIWEPATGTNFDEGAVEIVLERIEWKDHVARAYRPRAEFPDVEVDPEMRGGSPMLQGVRTSSVAELVSAGLSARLVAEDLGLTVEQIKRAVAFEEQLRGSRLAA